PFSAPLRFVSAHTEGGSAVFSRLLDPVLTTYEIPGMAYHEAYTLFQPLMNTNLSLESDILAVKANLPRESTISFPSPGGVILRYCDWPPGGSSPLHRHETIDFGIVIFGAMEAIMDSGETRVLKAGDCIVQRATMHAWKNASEKEWARVIFVIQGCEPAVVAGRRMGQDLSKFG
ncbi:oxalate oxidase GF-3.8, partial [Podospora aff. communis PSN243]